MGPKDVGQVLSLYANLMEEIRQRSSLIAQLSGSASPFSPVVSFEFCQLQMRMICETFALACLTAHGDIPEVKSSLLQKSYNAEKIFGRLTRLHPQFYPEPAFGERKQEADDMPPDIPAGTSFFHFTPRPGGFLTKENLVKSYNETGNYLHRGSVRKLIGSWKPEINLASISEWNKDLGQLISPYHIIALANGKMMICGFTEQKVSCAIAEPRPVAA